MFRAIITNKSLLKGYLQVTGQKMGRQKYGQRHLVPGNVRASKNASRVLQVQLQTLKDAVKPLHESFTSRPTEEEIFASVDSSVGNTPDVGISVSKETKVSATKGSRAQSVPAESSSTSRVTFSKYSS